MLLRISVPGQAANGGPLGHPIYGDQIQGRAIPGVPPEADVLVRNSFGRSVVTEAFEKADAATVEAVLQHSSAQGLEPKGGGEGGEGGEEWEMSGEATHVFNLTSAKGGEHAGGEAAGAPTGAV